MKFGDYYMAIQKELKQHNLFIIKCVAYDFFQRDYSVNQVVQSFLTIRKPQEPVKTIQDFK